MSETNVIAVKTVKHNDREVRITEESKRARFFNIEDNTILIIVEDSENMPKEEQKYHTFLYKKDVSTAIDFIEYPAFNYKNVNGKLVLDEEKGRRDWNIIIDLCLEDLFKAENGAPAIYELKKDLVKIRESLIES